MTLSINSPPAVKNHAQTDNKSNYLTVSQALRTKMDFTLKDTADLGKGLMAFLSFKFKKIKSLKELNEKSPALLFVGSCSCHLQTPGSLDYGSQSIGQGGSNTESVVSRDEHPHGYKDGGMNKRKGTAQRKPDGVSP